MANDVTTQNGAGRVTAQSIMQQSQQSAPASQGTQIEQSRAVAQVQGAIIVAQQRPRNELDAMQRMRDACGITALAERAFFRFPRGGQNVSGPSIHLATELARCWGNVDYGITELRRDEANHESEMLAYAWDLETNNRVTNSFIVPHKRDKRGGPEVLTDMRDIYENNANAGARRLRECIFRVLPVYFTEEAKTVCQTTLEDGGGKPMAQRREETAKAFKALGVSSAAIEKRLGVKVDKLTAEDLAQLRVIYQSIRRGEVKAEDEFPSDQAQTIAQDVKGQSTKPAPKPAKAAPSNDGALPLDQQPADAPAEDTGEITDEHYAQLLDAGWKAAHQGTQALVTWRDGLTKAEAEAVGEWFDQMDAKAAEVDG